MKLVINKLNIALIILVILCIAMPCIVYHYNHPTTTPVAKDGGQTNIINGGNGNSINGDVNNEYPSKTVTKTQYVNTPTSSTDTAPAPIANQPPQDTSERNPAH